MALDFDKYCQDWKSLATSIPSDIDYDVLYRTIDSGKGLVEMI